MTLAIPRDWPRPLAALCCILSEERDAQPPDLTPAEWKDLAEIALLRHRVGPALAGRSKNTSAPESIHELLSQEAKAHGWTVLRQMELTKQAKTR